MLQTPIIRKMVMTAILTAISVVGSFLRLDVVTLQVFFACISGMLLGPLWGALSQALYILVGFLGVPVFAQGAGFGYLAIPTCGFVLGLVPMAAIVGFLTKYRRFSLFWAGVIGLIPVYLIGVPYFYFGCGQPLTFEELMLISCLPYLPLDALKLWAATLLGKQLIPILRDDLRE